MQSLPAGATIAIPDAEPLGSVTLAPSAMTGRSEAALAQAMAEQVSAAARRSSAEALRALRETFPTTSLAVRVAALAALRGR
jgi:hypothetical protein